MFDRNMETEAGGRSTFTQKEQYAHKCGPQIKPPELFFKVSSFRITHESNGVRQSIYQGQVYGDETEQSRFITLAMFLAGEY